LVFKSFFGLPISDINNLRINVCKIFIKAIVLIKIIYTFAFPKYGVELLINWLLNFYIMYWTLELASKLEDAPWPATKEELIDYAVRSGAPLEVVENLQELEDDGEIYENIDDIWPDYPSKDDFFFNEDEY
jgi:hypothetical protein